ncbi:hypothetical protein GCK72_019533 [Caenorhabditis remanei]|uniref:Uncharacterized protein n=1 Tax=Caenorhabditis remanei TaxID=31234 RepID=A0A6A5GCV8_CAERE|nr:hypothetical protein GCK72_019533 [Caenorhabditis remanei]KAF1752978.1 hypothetical protein GCK72_019533 [Caenorhabditis remanei]
MGIPESVEELNLSFPKIGRSKEDGVIQRCERVRRRGHGCELFLHKELGLRRPKTLNASELVTLDAPVLQTVNLQKFRLLLCKHSQSIWLLSCLPAHGSNRDSSKLSGRQIPAKRTGTHLETSTLANSFSKQSLQLVKNSSNGLGRTMQQKTPSNVVTIRCSTGNPPIQFRIDTREATDTVADNKQEERAKFS